MLKNFGTKNTFNRSYNFIKNSKSDYKLMVIETHTKDFLII